MAQKKKKQTKIKAKKKLWFKIVAPQIFNSKEIGESYLVNAEQGLGRKMAISLRDLTGSMRDQNVKIKIKLSEVKGQALHSSAIGYQVLSTFIKRLVRKKTSRLDDVFVVKTKNGKPVVVKIIVVAYNVINRSLGTAIRMKVRSLIQKEFAKLEFQTIISNLVTLKIQQPIKRNINKMHPIKEVLVRSVELLDEAKAARTKETKIEEFKAKVKIDAKILKENELDAKEESTE